MSAQATVKPEPALAPNSIRDVERLEALHRTGLLDTASSLTFDRITSLAARLLRVPITLVSLVEEHRLFFKSQRGLPPAFAAIREAPLSRSICQHVVITRNTVVIDNAADHRLSCDSLGVQDMGVGAYLGSPIYAEDQAIGALCAINLQKRRWSVEDIKTLDDLAQLTTREIAAGHR